MDADFLFNGSNLLYRASCKVAAANYRLLQSRIGSLPADLHADLQYQIIYMLFYEDNSTALAVELSDPKKVALMLNYGHNVNRNVLHRAFQYLDNKHFTCDFSRNLHVMLKMCLNNGDMSAEEREQHVRMALTIGDFLTEAGRHITAIRILTTALTVIQMESDHHAILLALKCCEKLLKVQNIYCLYSDVGAMMECVIDMLQELSPETRQLYNKAPIYLELSVLLFAKSNYSEAYRHGLYALKELQKPGTPMNVKIDVLRLCSKACVVKRDYSSAELLIKHAVLLAYKHFGSKHPKYSDALLDYGFYLLSVDQVFQAVDVYKACLVLRKNIFGERNFYVAVAHEDLAYAYYVHEYNYGGFCHATDHADRSISIMEEILPANHLLLASSKRVRALVLEEKAIDSEYPREREDLLNEALRLHQDSLYLSINAFGQNNVQTAKHYGNLGRLYQTIREWSRAEKMHKKAIEIKRALLGNDDYEVALSVGHLASLYNYDMGKYDLAEELYHQSIDISLKLFGPGYSGLEYDYRGLIKLYGDIKDFDKQSHFIFKLEEWSQNRDSRAENLENPFSYLKKDQTNTTTGDISYLCFLLDTCRKICPDFDEMPSALDGLSSLPPGYFQVTPSEADCSLSSGTTLDVS